MTTQDAYYIQPLSKDQFHLYNPVVGRCRRAVLRGTLKKGSRREASLQQGERLKIRKLQGTKRWLISERSREKKIEVLERHSLLDECDYSD